MAKPFGNSVREVIESFRHLLADKGPLSDENVYSKRELYFLLLRYRARILSEKMRERGFSLSKHNTQTIPCIPVDEVDQNECPCAPASGCTFLKTRHPLPKTIGDVQSVTSLTGNIQYDYIQWERFEDIKHSRFKAEKVKPYFTLKNTGEGTYIYIYNDSHKEFITVTGIFEDPLEIFNFPDCKTGKCDSCFKPLEEEFILDPDLLPIVYDMALQQLIRGKQQSQDIFNDDMDNVTTTQTPIK